MCQIQEITIPNADPDVHLGQHVVPWVRFSAFVVENKHLLATHDTDTPRATLSEELGMLQLRILNIGYLRQFQDSRTLTDCVVKASASRATDPRDMVYGLLAMVSSARAWSSITADYTKSTREIFEAATLHMIREHPRLLYSKLPLHGLRPHHTSRPNPPMRLSSWTMDLTMIPQELGGRTYYNDPGCFVTHLGYSVFPLASIGQDSSLNTVGTAIGSIKETSQDLLVYERPARKQYEIFHQLYQGLIKAHDLSLEHMVHAILTTREIERKQLRRHLADILDSSDEAPFTDAQSHALNTLMHAAHYKTVFVTHEGHVGSTYHPDLINGMRSGDLVAGLFDVNLPFVLRRLDTGNYSMVNVAFVVGHKSQSTGLIYAESHVKEEDIYNNLERWGLDRYTIV